MVKKKVGKQRKDKFYQLAKETGYRSRAAFKLIQLNRKFEFLQRSRVCLDLCAAPGGWMQVAKQNMPVSSIVIGVDLFPIKPIPGCVCITGDITTDQCSHAITKELQSWKVDVVLHDGAPNVGQNWLFDAYQQVCLTLSAFKLATKFLRQGGWFVTKVFRSKDYNALLWVLKQFFKKVHATKPQASRNESAEIFVVCSQYSAPSHIDPKFLSPKYVFKELDLEPTLDKNFLRPDKSKKAKAEGYSELHPIYRKFGARDFISSETPLDILQASSEIVLDDEEILKQSETTKEIRECCKDIKVLGRKDLKSLLSWAKTLKSRLYPTEVKPPLLHDSSSDDNKLQVEGSFSDEEELNELDTKISQLESEDHQESKRKKKRAQKERTKLRQRLELKMVHKGDDGPVEEDPMQPMFNLRQITTHEELAGVIDQNPEVVADREEEEEVEGWYRSRNMKYNKETSDMQLLMEDNVKEESSEDEESDEDREGLGLSSGDENDEDSTETKKRVRFASDTNDEEKENPLITDLDHRDPQTKRSHKAALWFQKDVFKNLEVDEDEEFELNELSESVRKEGGTVISKDVPATQDPVINGSDKVAGDSEDDSETDDDSDSDSDSDYSLPDEMTQSIKVSNKSGDFEIAPKESSKKKKRKLDEEGLAVGSLMIQSKKKREEIIESGWNRYTFNDKNLPDWFQEYQQAHMKKEAPVPKELVEEYKKKKDELNVRPIKKVIEAKARKKKRSLKKLDQAKKKMESLLENPDVSEREKARQIQRMYKKAKEKKPEVTYVVARKHNAAKRMKRPKGVKGRYKVVDPRMKKDARKEKIMNKSGKKGKGGKKR